MASWFNGRNVNSSKQKAPRCVETLGSWIWTTLSAFNFESFFLLVFHMRIWWFLAVNALCIPAVNHKDNDHTSLKLKPHKIPPNADKKNFPNCNGITSVRLEMMLDCVLLLLFHPLALTATRILSVCLSVCGAWTSLYYSFWGTILHFPIQ